VKNLIYFGCPCCNTLSYLLICQTGPYNVSRLLDGFTDLQKQYGNIIKLNMGNKISLLIFNPDDIRSMFQHEGKYPQRPTFEALKDYREKKYQCVGVVPE
jgi:hypothetical protein